MSNVYIIRPLLEKYNIIDAFKKIQGYVYEDEKHYWKGYNFIMNTIEYNDFWRLINYYGVLSSSIIRTFVKSKEFLDKDKEFNEYGR